MITLYVTLPSDISRTMTLFDTRFLAVPEMLDVVVIGP